MNTEQSNDESFGHSGTDVSAAAESTSLKSTDAVDVESAVAQKKENTEAVEVKSSPCPSDVTIPESVLNALNLKFPKCSICRTEWYKILYEKENDNCCRSVDGGSIEGSGTKPQSDESNPTSTNKCDGEAVPDLNPPKSNPNESKTNKKQRLRRRRRPNGSSLIKLPTCRCATKLAWCPIQTTLESKCGNENEPSFENSSNHVMHPDLLRSLSETTTHSFKNLAICQNCLKERLKSANEVVEHDYRDDRPNGQRNVFYSVPLKCVQCSQILRERTLERLLPDKEQSGNRGGRMDPRHETKTKRKGKKSKKTVDWVEAVELTILLVGRVKREKRRAMKRERKQRQRHSHELTQQGKSPEGGDQFKPWWDEFGCCEGTDGSSDECFSYSSSSGGESEDCENELDLFSQPKTMVIRQHAQPGELLNDLMQKDPKFRMEKEDRKYVEKLVEEEEAEKRKLMELDIEYAKKLEDADKIALQAEMQEAEKEDRNLAKKLQAELSSSERVRKKKQSKKLPEGVTHSIVDAMKRVSPSSSRLSSINISDGRVSCENESPVVVPDRKQTEEQSLKEPSHDCAVQISVEPKTDSSLVLPRNDVVSTNGVLLSSDFCNGMLNTSSGSPGMSPTSKMSSNNSFFTPRRNKRMLNKVNKMSDKKRVATSAVKMSRSNEETEPTLAEEVSLSQMIGMGFDETEARQCLKDSDGDVDLAVTMLLSSFGADNNE